MASIEKRDGRAAPWQVRYRDLAGRQRARQFARKADARRFLAEVEHTVNAGSYVDRSDRTTFRDYAEGWRAAQVHRPTTAANVEQVLRVHAYPAFGAAPLGQVLPSHVQAWVKTLSATMAPATVAVSHGIVAAVFRAAVRDRRVASSPCEGTKLPRGHREPVAPLDPSAVAGIAAGLPARWRALVTLAAATGLRQGEALGLTVDRSGLAPPSARPALRVDRQLVLLNGEPPYLGPPKRRASRREVPLPRVAVEALAAHLAAFPAVSREIVCRDEAGRVSVETVALVFTTAAGEPVRRSAFSRAWRPAVAAAEAPAGTTFHDLRHFYASLLIRHGESVKVVQARLGHASAAETLDVYSHLWPDSEDRTRDAVDSVLGAGAWPGAPGVHRGSA